MHIGKNFHLDFSALALAALTALFVPSTVVLGGFCTNTNSSIASSPVAVSVASDTLSAVSGTELPLRITLTNNGESPIRDSDVVIAVIREPSSNDFSQDKQFILIRTVLKSGIDIEAHSTIKLAFAWRIPAALPSGVYRADVVLLKNGQVMNDSVAVTNNPFGNSAKVFISGEATSTVFFVPHISTDSAPRIALFNGTNSTVTLPITINLYSGNLFGSMLNSDSRVLSVEPHSIAEVTYPFPRQSFGITAEAVYKGVPAYYMYVSPGQSSDCFDKTSLYPWAMLIGGLGFLMLIGVYLVEKRNYD